MASPVEKELVAEDHQLNAELYRALLKEEHDQVLQLCQRTDDHAHGAPQGNLLEASRLGTQTSWRLASLRQNNPANDAGNTILHEAATVSQARVARMMLEKAPQLLNMQNRAGETALFRAAHYGKTETFDFLTEKIVEYDEGGKKPFLQRKDGTTILHIAILTEHFG